MSLFVIVGTGCSGGSAGDTPAQITSSIASQCKSGVVRDPLPTDDQMHERYRKLAADSMVIRCTQGPEQLSIYARFDSRDRLRSALHSIVLRPGRVEQFCVTDDEAFTTHFFGWGRVCRMAGGRIQNIRRPPKPSRLTHTYLPNCGNPDFLDFKPTQWSNGCTGGSANIRHVSWRRWGDHGALGKGAALLRRPCGPGCPVYRSVATVRLDRPRPCTDQGVTLVYFSRARYAVYLRAGNPFGEPEGWQKSTYETTASKCRLTRENPLLG